MNRLALALVIMIISNLASAAPSGVTYQGRILKPDGSPLTGTNVQFRMQIRAPDSNNCLMYEELQSQNLSASAGNFSITMNDGSGVRQDSTGLGLDRIFANRGSFTFDPATCSSGNSYNTGTGDGRVLQVYFKDETMSTWEPMPPQKINFVPFAFESKQVGGFGADNLLRFAESDGTLVNTSPLNNTQYTELLALVNGTSNAFEKAGKLGGVSLPALGVGQAGQVLSWNGTGWETADTVPTNSITTTKVQDGAITSAKIADGTIAGTDLAANIAISTTNTIATSGTMSSNIATTRDLRIYDADANPNENYVSIKVPASLSQNYNYVWPSAYGSAGQVLTTDATGNLSWAAPSAASQWSNGAAGAIYYNGGNVGIGTATPQAALDLSAGNLVTTGVISHPSAIGSSAGLQFDNLGRGFFNGVNGASHYLTVSNASTAIGSSASVNFKHGPTVSGGRIDSITRGSNNFDLALYSSASGTQGEGMRLLADGSVGIGTSAPNGLLDIESSRNGSAGIVNIRNLSNQSAATASIRFTNDSGGASLAIGATGSGNVVSSFGANRTFLSSNSGGLDIASTSASSASTLRFFTGGGAAGNERMRINDVGNIGVGKTNPSYLLDVNGAVNATALKINGVDVSTGGGTPGGATTQVQFNNAGAFAGSSDFVWNNTNSWLGVNMTPTAALSVSPKGGSFEAAVFRGNSSYKDVQQKLQAYDSSGRTMIAFDRPGVSQHSIAVEGGDNFYFGIGSNLNGPGEDLINMAPNGNVAIGKGISAPSGKLDVKGSIVMSGSTSGYAGFRVPAAAGSSVWQLPAADGVSGQALVTNGSGVLSWNSMASSNYWTKTISDISYTGGNVGIGTATPSVALDVAGQVNASLLAAVGGSSGVRPGLYLTNTATTAGSGASLLFNISGTSNASINSLVEATTTDASLVFSTRKTSGTPTEKMRVTSSGLVGIGTSTPTANLQVETDYGATLVVQNNNPTSNSNSSITLRNYRGSQGGGDPSIVSFASKGWPSAPAPVESGMVLMSLKGNGFAEAGFGADRTGASIDMVASGNWGNSVVPTDIIFKTGIVGDWANYERMRILSNGNIGIGVTAPTEKLEVSGNVKATSFISTSDARLKKNIEKTPGLDYVRQLTGVQWQWKSDNQTDAGVIAQDVERVMPFSVVTDSKTGFKAVKYNTLIAPLIESTKELDRSVASVVAENERLNQEVLKLKSENEQMKRDLDLIKERLGMSERD